MHKLSIERLFNSALDYCRSFKRNPNDIFRRILKDGTSRTRMYFNLLDSTTSSATSELPSNTSTGEACYYDNWPAVKLAFPKLHFQSNGIKQIDYGFIWGANASDANFCTLLATAANNGQVLLCEDGFLKSADTWANFNVPNRFRHGCSLVIDPYCFYFDATRSSLIERMLNDDGLNLNNDQLSRAAVLIDRIVRLKLTKYNHQPIFTPVIGRHNKNKVLVVDQSYGDYSISRGLASEQTFIDMLNAAIAENPDSDIIVKTHPDTMTGTRRGYYQNVIEKDNLYRMTEPINPYSLLGICDKVYVCSTQFGFEALMAGKEVHVFGMPFYAGWGLTIDAQHVDRRTRRRNLLEVFYIFYILYTHWFNPETGGPCEIEESINWLVQIRDEYSRWRHKNDKAST